MVGNQVRAKVCKPTEKLDLLLLYTAKMNQVSLVSSRTHLVSIIVRRSIMRLTEIYALWF